MISTGNPNAVPSRHDLNMGTRWSRVHRCQPRWNPRFSDALAAKYPHGAACQAGYQARSTSCPIRRASSSRSSRRDPRDRDPREIAPSAIGEPHVVAAHGHAEPRRDLDLRSCRRARRSRRRRTSRARAARGRETGGARRPRGDRRGPRAGPCRARGRARSPAGARRRAAPRGRPATAARPCRGGERARPLGLEQRRGLDAEDPAHRRLPRTLDPDPEVLARDVARDASRPSSRVDSVALAGLDERHERAGDVDALRSPPSRVSGAAADLERATRPRRPSALERSLAQRVVAAVRHLRKGRV